MGIQRGGVRLDHVNGTLLGGLQRPAYPLPGAEPFDPRPRSKPSTVDKQHTDLIARRDHGVTLVICGQRVVVEHRGQGDGALSLSSEVDHEIDGGGGLARRPLDDLRLDQRQSVANQAHPRHVRGQVPAGPRQPDRHLHRSLRCGRQNQSAQRLDRHHLHIGDRLLSHRRGHQYHRLAEIGKRSG